MDLNLIEIVSIISAIIPLFPISFLFQRREIHKSYYSVTWKLSKYLKPSDLLAERPFNEYYETRDFDRQDVDALKVHRNILIKGPSLAGKSRAIFEALKNNKESFDILIPICREIDPDSFIIPYRARFWRKGVVILDDLQRFVEQPGFERLIRETLNRGFIIVASSRTGKDFQLVESKFAQQGLDLKSLFYDCEIEIPPIDEDTARKVARQTRKEWARISFNGTIGSIFMELLEMKTRFANASDNEKAFLRVLKKLYDCGVYQDKGTFPLSWVRRILTEDEPLLNSLMESLQSKEFFKVDKNLIEVEPVYLEEIISLFPKIDTRKLCCGVAHVFYDNPQVLLKIGDRLRDLGKNEIRITDFMKDAIILYRRVLEYYQISVKPYEYALTQSHLGIAYAILADFEDTAENSRRAIETHLEALKIFTFDRFPFDYAQTQHNLGIVYGILAEVESTKENSQLAILACKEALKVYKPNKFPMAYAITQNNLGIAYGNLAKVEDKAKNIRRAISAFNDALNYLTIDRFPRDFAMTQLNLGNAYGTLSEVENKTENCRNAINACKEALKIFTIDHYPRDYAMTQNSLGGAYRNLAKIEEGIENCQRAVIAFENALKIFTVELFPMQYASIQANLGLAYWTLAESGGNVKDYQSAIDAWNKNLKIHTVDRFPREYARTQHNLGAAFLAIAKVKDKAENCRRAIAACNEVLKVRSLEECPTDYAMTQINLGTAYGTLAELENKIENCRLAWEAYRIAMRIYTADNFPMQYDQLQKNIEILKATCTSPQ
jgi:tetratricopeptide (TPR) repeat protein